MKWIYTIIILIFVSCNIEEKAELYAIDADELTFVKPATNPILQSDSTFIFNDPIKDTLVRWQKADVFNPAAIVKNDTVFMLYRSEDNPAAALGGRTSRIGLAYSTDGIHFTKYPEPVLYPDSSEFIIYDYPGGCEDPRVAVTKDGLYVMTYTSWNYDRARLSIAFSNDLITWEKKGPAFKKAYEGKFMDFWSKSGSIITDMKDGRQTIAQFDGKYAMYWGERFVNLAWSDNLIDWYPQLNEEGELNKLVLPRKGKFDSEFTECGPPAIMTERGIHLYYNGKNALDENADPDLAPGTYAVGRLIFDKTNPEILIDRLDNYFLKPTLPHEITGQYNAGTTFSEGLVFYQSKWFMYYGTADSYVGVAVME